MIHNYLLEVINETIGGYKALSTFGPAVQPVMKLIVAYAIGDVAIKLLTDGKKSATSGTAKNLEHLKGTDGFLLSKEHQLSIEASVQNVLVVGPPGVKKTSTFVDTQLLSDHFPANTSIVTNDSKGELWRDTRRYQESIGRKIYLFEPLGLRGHYNPLEFAEKFSEVRKLAEMILSGGSLAIRLDNGGGGLNGSDITWINMATPLLVASLLYHQKLGKPYNTISQAIKFILNPENDIEDILGNSEDEQVREQYQAFQMAIIKDKDGNVSETGPLTSILSTLANNVTLFLDPQIVEKTSYSDFSYKMLRDQRTALYIKYYPEDANYLSPLMSIIYTQLIEKGKKYEGKNKIIWLLDEAQNLGKINGLVKTLNTCRECGYAFMLVIQSVIGLYDIYGRSDTKAILADLQTKCILPGCSDIEMLREFSALAGDEEITIKQEVKSVKMKKNVFTPDEIRRLKKDEVLIISQNLKPIKTKQYRYYDDPDMLLNQYI